jgi:hypothetical protein
LSPDSRYDSIIAGRPVYNDLFSTQNEIKENLYGLYASIQHKVENVTFYAGLRGEKIEMDVYDLDDKTDWEYHKFHLFPYAQVSGNFGFYSTTFRFSTGIDQPSYWYYVPNRVYTSRYQYTIGNPYLHPSRLTTLRWENLLFDFIGLNINYLYTKDLYRPYFYRGSTDFEEIGSYFNTGNKHALSMNLYVPYLVLNEKLSGYMNISTSLFEKSTNLPSDIAFKNKRLDGWWVVRNSTEYKVTPKFSLGYSLRYQTFARFAQSETESYWSFDPFVSYTIGKFTLGIQAMDVFNTSKRKGTLYYGANVTTYETDNYAQYFGITIRYNLSKGKSDRRQSDEAADMNRFQK